jgi:hypothetical protein
MRLLKCSLLSIGASFLLGTLFVGIASTAIASVPALPFTYTVVKNGRLAEGFTSGVWVQRSDALEGDWVQVYAGRLLAEKDVRIKLSLSFPRNLEKSNATFILGSHGRIHFDQGAGTPVFEGFLFQKGARLSGSLPDSIRSRGVVDMEVTIRGKQFRISIQHSVVCETVLHELPSGPVGLYSGRSLVSVRDFTIESPCELPSMRVPLLPAKSKIPTVPCVDLSGDRSRQVVIAQGTPAVYQGHPTTVLLPDGKTILAVWTIGHGGPCGPMARSTDGGLTWSPVSTPADWRRCYNCPSIYLLKGPDNISRLMVFASWPCMSQTYSEDWGKTWSPVTRLNLPGVMAFASIMPLKDGRYLGLYHRDATAKGDFDQKPLTVWQSISADGGLTWGAPRKACDLGIFSPCEPCLIRSPDARQILCLMRENTRTLNSVWMTSNDEGATWSAPHELPAELTGDRHKACYTPDGRLVIAMRDNASGSPTVGHFVAWVGNYSDIVNGKPGQYRIKLLHSYAGGDCGYPGLECLPDGTMVATTYIKYNPGPENNSVVCTRFKLSETDAMLKR